MVNANSTTGAMHTQIKDAAASGSVEFPNGAETLLSTLLAGGVEVCFANPGTSEMHFVSALDKVPGMRPVLALFEGVATGAADGYGRMAGRPAATLLHLGPGLANGLANLHNARRAQAPVLNIVGDHATYHRRFDAPLTSDVEAYARTVSHWVMSSGKANTVAADAARAVQAAGAAPGQIATLILPADVAWSPAERAAPPLPAIGPSPVDEQAIARTIAALRAGGAALLLRGAALHGAGLRAAGRIAAATGARLLSDTLAPRIERGAGYAVVERLPYRPSAAMAALAGVQTLILVGTQAPVAFFAYPGQASELTPADCAQLVLAHPHEDLTGALEALAEALDPRRAAAVVQYRQSGELPPDGPLTGEQVMRVVASLLPEHAIISDESISEGLPYYGLLAGAAPHDHLNVSGGAIGSGMPVAVGAAIACPDRKVIALEGDGSAMYTPQALWTQAREQLNVVTVIFANRSYRILREELKIVGAGEPHPGAESLFDLESPRLDWVQISQGMGVEAVRVSTVKAFTDALRSALAANGPRLIEALI